MPWFWGRRTPKPREIDAVLRRVASMSRRLEPAYAPVTSSHLDRRLEEPGGER